MQREFIEKMVRLEEDRFRSTLTVGLNKLDELFASTKGAMPEYKAMARLYDTFGTRDLIRVGLEERGFVVEEDEFNRSFDAALQEFSRPPRLRSTRHEHRSIRFMKNAQIRL